MLHDNVALTYIEIVLREYCVTQDLNTSNLFINGCRQCELKWILFPFYFQKKESVNVAKFAFVKNSIMELGQVKKEEHCHTQQMTNCNKFVIFKMLNSAPLVGNSVPMI